MYPVVEMVRKLYNVSGGRCERCGAPLVAGPQEGCAACGRSGEATNESASLAHAAPPETAPVPRAPNAWRVIGVIHMIYFSASVVMSSVVIVATGAILFGWRGVRIDGSESLLLAPVALLLYAGTMVAHAMGWIAWGLSLAMVFVSRSFRRGASWAAWVTIAFLAIAAAQGAVLLAVGRMQVVSVVSMTYCVAAIIAVSRGFFAEGTRATKPIAVNRRFARHDRPTINT